MINAITSFFDNAKEKLTNPFFGTLITVWLVRNWELVYTLFNFDKDCNLDDKKRFIIFYFENKNFWIELFSNVGISLGLMLFGYLLIIITRVIINVIENNLMPFLNKKTVSKLVTSIGIHESVVKQRDEFFEKYGVERDKARDAVRAFDSLKLSSEKESEDYQNQINIFEDQVSSLEGQINDFEEKIRLLNDGSTSQGQLIIQLESSIQTKQNEINDLKIKLLRKIEDSNEIEKIILDELKRDYRHKLSNQDIFRNSNLSEIYHQLKEKDQILAFTQFVDHIEGKQDGSLSSEYLNEFVNMKLFRYKDSTSKKLNSFSNVELTGIGKIISVFIELKNH